ncbi:MAG: isocitrate lyase/phosphoenolpyruvate mutase family protein [Bryobacteraceae bacterium]
MRQRDKAEAFRRLHDGPPILVLPNAWDSASARIFEDAGFPAIGTTSAGIANSLGYPDGQYTPGREMLAAVERIVRAVAVPVTADVEAGYGYSVVAAAEIAGRVIAAGAVGLNLEDTAEQEGTLLDAALQSARIAAMRETANALRVPLVINARTDVFLASIGDPATRFDRAVERAAAYHRAGADCLFIPGVRDAETIGRLVRALPGPLNILADPGAPPATELQRLGVARMSVGSGPMRAVMGLTRRIAEELHRDGASASMYDQAIPYAEANALFLNS